jgi:hypothetical protein
MSSEILYKSALTMNIFQFCMFHYGSIDRYTNTLFLFMTSCYARILLHCDTKPVSLVRWHQRFGGTYCCHPQGTRINAIYSPTWKLLAIESSPMRRPTYQKHMVSHSRTPYSWHLHITNHGVTSQNNIIMTPTYKTTQCNNPEHHNLDTCVPSQMVSHSRTP